MLQKEAKIELDWWVQNLELNNRRLILSTAQQIVIRFSASKSGWAAVPQVQSAWGLLVGRGRKSWYQPSRIES